MDNQHGQAPDHRLSGRASCALEGPALQIGAHDAGYEQAEARVTMDQLTAGLDRRAREILRLRFGEDLLQSEIAARVGCSQMHVSRLLRRALTRIETAAAAAA